MEIITKEMAKMTWQEIEQCIGEGYGVILPIGSTEQHGPALPISTDAICAKEVSLGAAENTKMLVAPTIQYGYRSRPLSGGGATFPGTTNLSGHTLISVIEDILEEFARMGFKKVSVLSMHMENQNFIYEGSYLVSRRHPDMKIMVMESAFGEVPEEIMQKLFPDGFPGWAREHAACMEVSIMLYRHPDLVRFDRAVNDNSEEYPFYDVLPPDPRFFTKSGTLWHAREATVEKGKLIWDEIIKQASAAINKEFPA